MPLLLIEKGGGLTHGDSCGVSVGNLVGTFGLSEVMRGSTLSHLSRQHDKSYGALVEPELAVLAPFLVWTLSRAPEKI